MAIKGGMVNDLGLGGAGKKVTVDDAVEFAGSVVTIKNTGNYGLTADGGDPQGLLLTSSVDPNTNIHVDSTPVYRTGASISKFPMITGMRWSIPIADDNDAIAIGDKIVTCGSGKGEKYVSGAAWQIGIATEEVAHEAGGYVTVEIDKRYIPA